MERKTKRKNKHGGGSGGNDGLVHETASNVRSNYGIGEIRLGGYLFARGDLQRLDRTTVNSIGVPVTRDLNTLDLSIPSVRFRIDYQSPWEGLTAQVEVDFAGQPDLRDGYIQAKGKHVAFRMGQFKMPVLAMQMESPWVLPLVRRGLIHDLTVDWLDVAGRLPGAMMTLREKLGDIKPRLYLGAFQARRFVEIDLDGTRDTDLIRELALSSQKLVARGQVDIGSVEIGVVYEHRLGSPVYSQLRRLWTAGGDVTVNHVFATGGLRVWVDGLAGASWTSSPSSRRRERHVRHGARAGGLPLRRCRARGAYVEPYVFGGISIRTSRSPRTWPGKRRPASTSDSSARARVTLQAEMDQRPAQLPRPATSPAAVPGSPRR